MFETVSERVDVNKQERPKVRVRFDQQKNDPFPRLVVIISKDFLNQLGWDNKKPMGLAIGMDEDKGLLKLLPTSNVRIGSVRRMKLGGAIIDYGCIKAIDELYAPMRYPSKAAAVHKVDNDGTVTILLPKWDDAEALPDKPRGGGRKNKKVTQEQPAPAPRSFGNNAGKPNVTVTPPAIYFNNKKATVTEFQAVLLLAMSKHFQTPVPASRIIEEGYKEAGKPSPNAAEASLPQALMGIQGTLRNLGLKTVHVKGIGWGLDTIVA